MSYTDNLLTYIESATTKLAKGNMTADEEAKLLERITNAHNIMDKAFTTSSKLDAADADAEMKRESHEHAMKDADRRFALSEKEFEFKRKTDEAERAAKKAENDRQYALSDRKQKLDEQKLAAEGEKAKSQLAFDEKKLRSEELRAGAERSMKIEEAAKDRDVTIRKLAAEESNNKAKLQQDWDIAREERTLKDKMHTQDLAQQANQQEEDFKFKREELTAKTEIETRRIEVDKEKIHVEALKSEAIVTEQKGAKFRNVMTAVGIAAGVGLSSMVGAFAEQNGVMLARGMGNKFAETLMRAAIGKIL